MLVQEMIIPSEFKTLCSWCGKPITDDVNKKPYNGEYICPMCHIGRLIDKHKREELQNVH